MEVPANFATPVVALGTVYAATLGQRLFALSAADGSVIWRQRRLRANPTATQFSTRGSPRIIVGLGLSGAPEVPFVAAFHARDGRRGWHSDPLPGSPGLPVLLAGYGPFSGVVAIERTLLLFDAETGDELHRLDLGANIDELAWWVR